jgi:hypothetical protein
MTVTLAEQIQGLVTAVMMAALGLFTIGWTAHHADTVVQQRKMFLQALLLRYFSGLCLYAFNINAVLIGMGDDAGSWHGLKYQAFLDEPENGLSALPSYLVNTFVGINRGYGPWIGLFFYLTRLTGQFTVISISAFAGAMTVVVVYRLARTLFSEAVATRAAYWTMLFPSMVLWSSLPQKEPIVILLEVAAIYACVRLRHDGLSVRHVLLCLASLLLLLSMRFYVFYIESAVVLASLLVFRAGARSLSATQGLAVGVVLLVPVYFISGSLKAHMDFFEKRANLSEAERFRAAVSKGSEGETTASGLQLDYDLGTTRGFAMQAVVGAAHLLLAPFPWQVRFGSLRMMLTTPEMLYWWFMLFAWVLPGFVILSRQRLGDLVPMLLFMVLLGSVYSMTCGNIGIIYRQRAQFLPYFFMIGAYGAVRRREDPWGRPLPTMRMPYLPNLEEAPTVPIPWTQGPPGWVGPGPGPSGPPMDDRGSVPGLPYRP